MSSLHRATLPALALAVVGAVLWFPLEATHWITRALGDGHGHVPAQQTWLGWASVIAGTLALVYLGGKFYRSAWSALRRGTSNNVNPRVQIPRCQDDIDVVSIVGQASSKTPRVFDSCLDQTLLEGGIS